MMLCSVEFHSICLVCFFLTSASLSITPSGTFEIDKEANLTCTNQPYQGIQIWTVDAVQVLFCDSSTCNETPPDPRRFRFNNDRSSGIFVFTIGQVLLSDNGSIFGCSDGNEVITFILEVQGCGRLPNITNGNVQLRDENKTSFGAKADVSCDTGYETNSPTIICQENNTWTESVCTKKGGLCGVDKCISVVIVVVTVAWASSIVETFVGAFIWKRCFKKKNLLECILVLASLPWIFDFLIGVIRICKTKTEKRLILLSVCFLLVDTAFVGTLLYFCYCKELTCSEMWNLLWALFIYPILCVLASALKYITVEIWCTKVGRECNSNSNQVVDKSESNSNPVGEVSESDSNPVGDESDSNSNPVGDESDSNSNPVGDESDSNSNPVGDESDSNINPVGDESDSNSNPGSEPTVIAHSKKETDTTKTRRTLPRLPSVNSRLVNEKEYQHSVNSVKLEHRPLPPITTKEKG